MDTVRVLKVDQGEILEKMSIHHVHDYEYKFSQLILGITSEEDVEWLQAHFVQDLGKYNEYLSTLPARGSIGQYIFVSGNLQTPPYRSHESVVITGGKVFEVPGRSVSEVIHAAYDALEKMLVVIPKLQMLLEHERFRITFGWNAPTPYREIGLLEGIITREQMKLMLHVLQNLTGTIDLHQFRKSDAAMILNTLRERMNFVVNSDLHIRFIHAKGESDWYGLGDGRGKKVRDQVKHITSSSTYTPSTIVAKWINALTVR